MWGNTLNGIQIGHNGTSSQANISIQDCTVFGNSNDGIQVKSNSERFLGGHVVLSRLTVFDNGYRNIFIQADDVELLRVTSFTRSSAVNRGIVIVDGIGLSLRHLTQYRQNTSAYPMLSIEGSRVDNLVIENSIFASQNEETLPIAINANVGPFGKNIQIDYNLYSMSATRSLWRYGDTPFAFVDWQQTAGFDLHSLVQADPLFIDIINADFSLAISSPAIDHAADIGESYSGIAPDIGAIEYSSQPATAALPPVSEIMKVIAGIGGILAIFVCLFLWVGKERPTPNYTRKERS